MKRFVKEYLTFSKKDRVGILCLLALLLVIYLLPKWFTKNPDEFIKPSPTLAAFIDTLQQRVAHSDKPSYQAAMNHHYGPEPSVEFPTAENAERFDFDPNTASAEEWKRLGLPTKTIQTIFHYRSKGGHFYKPADLQKIWGLPDGFYEQVKDYIHIASEKNSSFFASSISPVTAKEEKERFKPIDVNSADTTQLIRLPGIGSKLSVRILNFRDKLGGFYSVDQISETYGLPDSTFQKIKSFLITDINGVRKININTATKEELKSHPYIRWNLANAIVEYRNQHGKYFTVEDVKKITLVTPEVFKKIVPYLQVD